MKFNYPQSIPCYFDNFPAALEIRLGKLAGSIIEGTSLGSRFVLRRTPNFCVPQSEYIAGSALPDCRAIYSDTGNDDDFVLKVSFFGHGTFYKKTESDKHLMFEVYKAIAIKTQTIKEIIFGSSFTCETLIDSDENVESLFSYSLSKWQFTDDANYNSENKTISVGGNILLIEKGESLELKSLYGRAITVTVINGIVTIL